MTSTEAVVAAEANIIQAQCKTRKKREINWKYEVELAILYENLLFFYYFYLDWLH